MAVGDGLRPYQSSIAYAVLESVKNQLGLTFTVEIARQGGKNEVAARLEAQLLMEHMSEGGNLIKAAPTFTPQVRISIDRLKGWLSVWAKTARGGWREVTSSGWAGRGKCSSAPSRRPMWWATPPTCCWRWMRPRTSIRRSITGNFGPWPPPPTPPPSSMAYPGTAALCCKRPKSRTWS
jgi:hypothetical protein